MTSIPNDPSSSTPPISNTFLRLLGLPSPQDGAIEERVIESAELRDGAYWLELLFAAGIATLGLLVNSPAVIIGAMLISPIMGPILATGLGMAAGDLRLTIRAAGKLLLSAATAVVFAALLVAILPFREMTPEIAARTQPNTIDLAIALFAGTVGSVSLYKSLRGAATSIPGVAIAVALMPPLCVVGYGIAVMAMLDPIQGAAIARGAGLLFATNVAGIVLTTVIVFFLARIQRSPDGERSPSSGASGSRYRLSMRLRLIVAFVLILLIPLYRSYAVMKSELAQKRIESETHRKIAALWDQSFARNPDGSIRSYVDTFSVDESAIHMRIFSNRSYSAMERAAFAERLATALQRKVDVQLVEIPTARHGAQHAR
jgi:uncharacterized hydrophobic protein (TIGR00271 family)